MIIELLFDVVELFVDILVALLPQVSLSSLFPGFATALGASFGFLKMFEFVFPITLLIYVFSLFIIMEASILTVKLSLIVYSMIRGKVEYHI